MARHGAGMTLLEMLVVFVLVALLSVLIVQGAGFFLGGYQAVVRANHGIARDALQRRWFAASVRGMVASQLAARRFQGAPDALEGLTLQPVVGESGLPVKVRWTLRESTSGAVLVYREGKDAFGEKAIEWTLPVPEAGQGPPRAAGLAFQYADRLGGWQDAWPLPHAPRERLPRAVRLVAETGEALWFVRLDQHYEPIFVNDEVAWTAPADLVAPSAA